MNEVYEEKDYSSLKELVESAKAMSEGNFYKEVNTKLKGELGDLARFINITMQNLQFLDPPVRESSQRMPEVSSQLFDVNKAAEEATHKVLSLTEKILEDQEALSLQISKLKNVVETTKPVNGDLHDIIGELKRINEEDKNGLIEILSNLSFQDLTGQKIKKVMVTLEEVQTRLLECIMAFGITIKDEGEIISQLKDSSVSKDLKQDLVDEILRELG